MSCMVCMDRSLDGMSTINAISLKMFLTFLFCSTTKASLVAAIIFTLEKYHFIAAPHVMIYFGVVIFFVYFKLSSLFLGIHDPFVPFENLFCAVFMGGMWDALRRAVQKEPKKGDDHGTELKNEVIKSKEEKKKD